jgi:diadenosine tetraphosphate (Ap4A) HIT family hydrolase
MNCSLCDRIQNIKKDPRFIIEWQESLWLIGDHQYYPGYTMLVSKTHFKEMHHMPEDKRSQFLKEFNLAQSVIEKVFNPFKINLCSLGNKVPHVHWHIFPRFEDDSTRFDPPWLKMHEFSSRLGSTSEVQELKQKILSALGSFSVTI